MEASADSPLVDLEASQHEASCEQHPSSCMCPGVFWIWARRQHKRNAPPSSSLRTSTSTSTSTTKADGRNMSGKWMIFPATADVDAVWHRVRELLAAGKLGDTAKVAPRIRVTGPHLICVYTNDWSDAADVFRVLCTLRDELPFAATSDLHYKTDEATRTAQYSNSENAITAGFADAVTPTHKNYRVSLYTSPSLAGPPASEAVQLVQNNIGAEYRWGVVAERVPASVAPEGKSEACSSLVEPEFVTNFYSPEELRKPKRGRGTDKPSRKKAKVTGTEQK